MVKNEIGPVGQHKIPFEMMNSDPTPWHYRGDTDKAKYVEEAYAGSIGITWKLERLSQASSVYTHFT